MGVKAWKKRSGIKEGLVSLLTIVYIYTSVFIQTGNIHLFLMRPEKP